MLVKFVNMGLWSNDISLWDQNKRIGQIKVGELLFVLKTSPTSIKKFFDILVLTLNGQVGENRVRLEELQKL